MLVQRRLDFIINNKKLSVKGGLDLTINIKKTVSDLDFCNFIKMLGINFVKEGGESHHAALGSTIYRSLQELRGPPSHPPPTHIQAANMPPKSKKTSADLSLAIILVVFRVASHK